MVAPTDYDITITINAVDVTAFVPFESLSHTDYPRQVSTFNMLVQNPTGVTPARNHEVIITANSLAGTPMIFLGYIMELKTRKEKDSINVFYECECACRKILLQRSVLDIDEITGSDTSILSSLLSNAYPDLSSYFDFTTNVTNFANDLTLPVGNSSIMDALNDLSELTGGHYSFDDTTGTGGFDLMSFGGGEDINLSTESAVEPYVSMTQNIGATPLPAFTSGGNPGNGAIYQPNSGSTGSTWYFRVNFQLHTTLAAANLTNLVFDYYIGSDLSSDTDIRIVLNTNSGIKIHTFTSLTYDSWATLDVGNDGGGSLFPFDIGVNGGGLTEIFIEVKSSTVFDTSAITFDLRFDNVKIYQTPTITSGNSNNDTALNWGDTPPESDFDFDIDLSDEFGFDFELSEGDFNDYNSITIVGGNAEDAIDWTYPNQDSQTHINLETAVSDIAVSKNTGIEGTPTWTAQTVGVYGTDDLASVDVLYDKLNHWLLFATAPPNFYDSIRITGTILRPIRVRVEDVGAGEPTYATIVENKSITSIDQAVAVGDSKLNKRNAVKNLTFKTYEPGLKSGQSLTVTDTDRGLSEALVIQSISTRWISGKNAIFTVECGSDEAVGVDTIIANNDKRSRDNQIAAGATVVTAVFYTGDSGNKLTDDSDNTLYGYE